MPDQTQAPTATFQRESQTTSGDPSRLKRFRQTTLFLSAAAVFAIAFYTILGLATGVWQIAAEAGLIIVGVVCLALGYRAARRGQFDLAGYLVLFGLALVYGGPELLWSGATIYLAIGGLLLLFLFGNLLLPRRPRSWFIATGLFCVFLWLANRLNLWPRFDYSQSPFLNLFVPFITLALAAASLWQIAQAFRVGTMRTKLVIAFLAVSLVSVGAITLYADRTIRLTLQDQVSAELTNIAQQQGTTIGDLLVKEVELLQAASLDEAIRSQAVASNAAYQGSPADIQAAILVLDREWIAAVEANNDNSPLIRSKLDNPIAEYLRRYRAAYLENVEVFVTDRYGASLGATNRTSDYYQADEDWWQAAFNNGNGAVYYAQPEYDESSGRYSINIALPLYDRDGKTIIGVMRTTLDLEIIVTMLTDAQVGQTGRVDMLLPNNHFVEAQGPKDVPPDLLARLPTPLAGTSEVDWEGGVPSFAAVAPIRSSDPEEGSTIGQLNWQIVAHQSRAEVLAPVDAQTRTILLVIAVVAVIVVGASVGLSQILVRPIAHLTTVATKVSEGDLTAQAAVETGDEVGTLAVTFNNMTAQLRGMVGTLEDRVTVRTDQLRASAEVGRAASSILDADQLLHETVNVIAGRFGFYYVAVFTLDPNEQFAVLRAATGEAGRILLDRGHRLPLDHQSMVGAAILNRHARIALDVGQEAVRFANPLLPNTRSEIALPLIVGQRAIGALDVQSERAGAFDEASADVLQAMADQIAIALQNAESFTRSEQQTQTLAVLNQLSRELALAGNYEGIARALRTSVVNLIGPQQIALLLASSDPQRLTVYPLDLEREPVLGESRLVETARSRAGDSLTSDQTLYVPDLTTAPDPYHENASLIQAGLRSTLIVPLRVGDKRLGTLNVGHDTPNAYSPEMINRMEQVAAQLAVALENLNLVEQTRQALNELDAANRRLIGQAWGKYLQASGQISAEWREGAWIKNADEKQKTAISIAPHPAANLQLPIKVRGQTIGEFNVMTTGTPHTWSEEDVTFAQSLVDQVGQMIENARLLEETERFAQRERTINEINSRVRQTIDLDAILKTAVNELGQSLKAARVVARVGVSPGDSETASAGNERGDDHE